jgi:eukaryotic-like serine/threonine-protein kinase
MALSSGTRLGPYEIGTPLGAGGMGEVYRARDTRLERDVALKILPESFSRDRDRMYRFEQEARAVAALNHPNILAVFDIGRHKGAPFLVSELLEGESLRDVLDRGVLPSRKTIDYGVQIAQGLAAAHEKGVVHRDLKPENVFVTRDGRIKILDFGLAKLAQKTSAAAEPEAITRTRLQTAAGVVMGTASYMAPEQARGEGADARTDIFAFGTLLYEMLSGQRAFRRDTAAETMTAVLKEDPQDLSNAVPAISPVLDRIVRRCLEKSPEQRFQSAKDLSFALGALSGTEGSGARRVAPAPVRIPWLQWAGIAFALVAVAAASWFLARRPPRTTSRQFAIPVAGEVSHMAVSADGSMLAFVSPEEKSGMPMLYLQAVGSAEVRMLPGTEEATYPFWSPDGAYIAFFANGKLKKVAISGGAPQVLAQVWAARGGSWGRQNVIIYEPDAGSPIWRINSDGSGAAPVTDHIFAGQDQTHRWPVFLPDGNHFLFWAGNFAGVKGDQLSGIFVASLDGKEKRLVTLAHSSFALDTHHLFYADDERHLVAVGFDSGKATISGSTAVIANAVAFQPSTYWVALTAAANGTLIYNTSAGAVLSVLTWMDRTGKQLGQIGEPAVQCNPSLSPDGSRVAVDISDQKANNVDIWLESTTGGSNSRFTFDPSEEVVGVWSRDGKTLAYRSAGGNSGFSGLLLKPANGLESEQKIFGGKGSDDIIPDSWSPGDQQILFTHQSLSGYHLELLPSAGGNSMPFQTGAGNQTNGMISPDGKWVAYASDESGSWEIYVTTFPGAAGKWQVSRGGGTEPRWRGDGKEIFYIGPTGMLFAVPVMSQGDFSTGVPLSLFQFHGRAAISSTDVFSYDVTKDGKRFLINRYVKPENVTPLTIVLQTVAELQ